MNRIEMEKQTEKRTLARDTVAEWEKEIRTNIKEYPQPPKTLRI